MCYLTLPRTEFEKPTFLFAQALYRQGVALQCLGRHGDALAVFSTGLAQDPKSPHLLAGLVEASLKSPLRGNQSFLIQVDDTTYLMLSTANVFSLRLIQFLLIFADALEPTFKQLQAMRLNTCAFVIISVVGQELLGAGQYSPAVIVLESALKIGTCSLKLRGSVFSALSSAYWALNSLDKVSLIVDVIIKCFSIRQKVTFSGLSRNN